jgi:hypothetical protein
LSALVSALHGRNAAQGDNDLSLEQGTCSIGKVALMEMQAIAGFRRHVCKSSPEP